MRSYPRTYGARGSGRRECARVYNVPRQGYTLQYPHTRERAARPPCGVESASISPSRESKRRHSGGYAPHIRLTAALCRASRGLCRLLDSREELDSAREPHTALRLCGVMNSVELRSPEVEYPYRGTCIPHELLSLTFSSARDTLLIMQK